MVTFPWLAVVVFVALLLATMVIALWSRRQVQAKMRHLLAEQAKGNAILDALPDLLFELGLDGIHYDYHAPHGGVVSAPSSLFIGKSVFEVLPVSAAERVMSALQEAHATGRSGGQQFSLPLPAGERWFEISVARKGPAAGDASRFILLSRDITERKQAESELRLAAIAFEAQEGVLITDAQRIVLRANRAFSEITGYAVEDIVGHSPRLLNSGHHDAVFFQELDASLAEHGYWQGEIWNRCKNGEKHPQWITITEVKDVQGAITNYVATFTDITARKLAEDEIRNLAFYDALTGLPNRRLLMDRLKQALAASQRSQKMGGLLFIDLDNFKNLNDTHGHDVGDILLKQVAERLTTCVREGDTIARLGGDEFVVILEGLSDANAEAATQVEAVAVKVVESLGETYWLGDYTHHSTPSIGITLFLGHEHSIDELMKRVDMAMYQAKAAGRNTLRFFDPEMQSVITARAQLEDDLRNAIVNEQFVLYYQPQVDHTRRIIGAEALIRWQHPQRGMVSPALFIPQAEESGLILPLGHWVLHTACQQLAAWAADPALAHLTLAVNVSARQFRLPNLAEDILALLTHTGAPPQRLKIELTESLLAENTEDIIKKMNQLKSHGVGFSLDDFGTGYSSLSYIKRLPLDQLKIDQSFVRDILDDPNDAAISRTVVALAESLSLSVIAEGVETEAQRTLLETQGCKTYQGYLFSRPLPSEAFERYVKAS